MKLYDIFVTILIILLLAGCATTKIKPIVQSPKNIWVPVCWHKAVFQAITVESLGYETRIVEGYRNNTRHAETQVKLENAWWYIDYNGFHIYTKTVVEGFEPMEAFTLEQYLVRMKHWFKERK